MKTESTIEIMAVVTPNCAMASRSQTSSYNTLQKPEMRKKMKYQFTQDSLSSAGWQFHDKFVSAHVECREVKRARQGRRHQSADRDHVGTAPRLSIRAKLESLRTRPGQFHSGLNPTADPIQLTAVGAQAAELRFTGAHKMPARSAVKRSTRASGEVDHLFEFAVLHAKRAADRTRLTA